MNNFVTIKTFMFPSEAIVIRGRLESEGIECFVKDELISQVNPFYSNAMGGVKLQVRESDVPEAMQILKEGGYLTEEVPRSSLFTLRRMLLLGVIIVLIAIVLYMASLLGFI